MNKLGVSYNSIKKYSKLLHTGKLADLFIDNMYRNKSELEDYTEAILLELEENPVRTLCEATLLRKSPVLKGVFIVSECF